MMMMDVVNDDNDDVDDVDDGNEYFKVFLFI